MIIRLLDWISEWIAKVELENGELYNWIVSSGDCSVLYMVVWLRELSFGEAYQAEIRRRQMGRNYVRETAWL